MRFTFLLALCMLWACQSKQKNAESVAKQPPPPPVEAPAKEKEAIAKDTPKTQAVKAGKQCYFLAEGVDSTFVSFDIKADGKVTGTFDWYPHEQHGAYGTLDGTIVNDMITAMYDYEIEGSQQQEQKIFKITANGMEEYLGELTEGENGALIIKDPSKGKYQAFKTLDCAVRDRSLSERSGGIM